MANTIKIKRGLKDNLPALEIGEMGYCTDTNELFIGTNEGNELINEDSTINALGDIGDIVLTDLAEGDILIYDGTNWVNEKGTDIFAPTPFAIFTDTSGSPGSATPINDLDGNIMADLDKDIAYYGTVSHTDLYTSDDLASEVGVTQGTSMLNQEVWHKYYWNGGIHFWRKPIRHSVSWNAIAAEGAVYGTGTTTSRKGHSGTNVNQNAEVTKNGVTYGVRMMEGANVDPAATTSVDMHNCEFSLIILNLHAATNSGQYDSSFYNGGNANWDFDDVGWTNDDFVGWSTNFIDIDFNLSSAANPGLIGSTHFSQENLLSNTNNNILRGGFRTIGSNSNSKTFAFNDFSWAPVLTVKHSSFTYE